MKSLVSIIIPTYNRAHLIGETLDSIINQNYPNWECLVIDDGSNDYTKELMEFYSKDKRIKYCHHPDNYKKGANACRNYALRNCKGDYIKFLDSDDLLITDSLLIQAAHLQNNPHLDVSIAYVNYFNGSLDSNWKSKPKKLFSDDLVFDYVMGDFFLSTAGPLWRSSFLKEHHFFFNEKFYRLQDTEFHYRIILKGLNFEFLDRAVVNYRFNTPDAITLDSSDRNLGSIFKYWLYVLNTAKCQNTTNQKRMERFVANNISLVFHRILLNQDSILNRLKTTYIYWRDLMCTLKNANIPAAQKLKFYAGIIITIITRKGLRFFRIT
ncbi:glycosyltransferase family 2 protein [Salegentibacter sp. T436]|uniref:glycosyltransferase family 2 protein n=1 Tax=Salegentibacter sp. T436 TaxID=1729720 RepID=UPI00094AD52C|nr:glycosyltransferase family 2 protein [Salegentibacter sp. T436]